jgi:polyisoprenoid-binding protein YceI
MTQSRRRGAPQLRYRVACWTFPRARAYGCAVADFTGTYELGPGAGRVLVKTGRAGLAAKVGHDLTMEITRWSARVTVPDDGLAAATLTADLDLGSLAVREGTGGAKPLTDKDRRDILNSATKILGASATASFASTGVIPAPGGGAIEGTLTLHGASRPLRIQVISPARGHYRGTAVVRQSDFGITPYSGFFGALKLRDEVTVEFEVQFAP